MSTGVLASSSSPFVSDEFGPSARTVEQLRAQFQSADTNADGRLDQDEIVAIMTQNGIESGEAMRSEGVGCACPLRAGARVVFSRLSRLVLCRSCSPAAASKHAATLFRITNANTTNEDDATKQQLGMTYAEFVQEFVRLARFQSIKAIQARFNEIDTVRTQEENDERDTDKLFRSPVFVSSFVSFCVRELIVSFPGRRRHPVACRAARVAGATSRRGCSVIARRHRLRRDDISRARWPHRCQVVLAVPP